MSAGQEGIAGVLGEHWPHPVFGCECTPEDDDSGIKESLDGPWEAHVAAAVVAWVTERLASEEVREAVARAIGGMDKRNWWDATAALTAVSEALRGPS